MSVQFFKKDGEKLVEDGEPLILNKGTCGVHESGRIHDATIFGRLQVGLRARSRQTRKTHVVDTHRYISIY